MVTPLTFSGGDGALVDALRAGHPGAAATFYDQHAAAVRSTLQSVLGPDPDVPDLLQEVFIRAIDQIGELEHIDQVRSWLTTIAVFTARAHLRRQARRHWLFSLSPQQTGEKHWEPASGDTRLALRALYRILDRMPADERIAFVLRFVEGMTLPETAEACRVSLATIKRRLSRAEKRFVGRVRGQPLLETWLQEGTRWSLQKHG